MSNYNQEDNIIINSSSVVSGKVNPIVFSKDKLVASQSTEDRLVYRRPDGNTYTQILAKRTTKPGRKTISK